MEQTSTEQVASPVDELLHLQQAIVDRIAKKDDLDSILVDLCRLVEGMRPGAICSIMRLDPETETLFVRSGPNVPRELIEALDGLVPGCQSGSCGVACFTGEMTIVEDTRNDPRWAELQDVVERFGLRSCWSIPIRVAESRVIGTFAISSPEPGKPTQHELELLRTAGHLAAIAFVHTEAEEKLRKQQRLLQGIIEGIEDPIFVKNRDLEYIVANSAEVRGVADSLESMLGKDDYDFYPREQAARHQRVDREILASGDSRQYEETYDNPLEGKRTFLVRKSPLRTDDERPSGVIGIARDISELRKAEQAVLQSQKLESLGVLTGGIAHDFNNILTAILGSADVALAQEPLDSNVRDNLEVIRRSAQRAAELTHQMLAYAGKADADKRLVYLPELLDDVLELVHSSVSKKARLSIQVTDDLPHVQADPAQLRQLVMNLVTNASEALENEAGTIEVRMRIEDLEPQGGGLAPGRYVRMTVQDDGVGMDTQTMASIFDPFFTTKFAGRGLGLAAVQGIVRGHEGSIEVTSRVGEGTTFEVLLPASPVPADEDTALTEQKSGAGRETILVVEDEDPILGLLETILRGAGYDVLKAMHGSQGVELFERHAERIDLVLLDWTTTHMSGRDVLVRMKELRPDIPVLLSSGYPEGIATADFQGGELIGFLKKPYTPARLLQCIRKAFEPSH